MTGGGGSEWGLTGQPFPHRGLQRGVAQSTCLAPPLSEHPVSPGLNIWHLQKHAPAPGVSQLALNPNLTLSLRLAFPSFHQLQPFHPPS